MSQPNFSLGFNFVVKTSEENEGLCDKTPLTDQKVDVFLDE